MCGGVPCNPRFLDRYVYHDDEEAFEYWSKDIGLSEDRIIRIATSDNFWSMGDTGPCPYQQIA